MSKFDNGNVKYKFLLLCLKINARSVNIFQDLKTMATEAGSISEIIASQHLTEQMMEQNFSLQKENHHYVESFLPSSLPV